MALAIPASSSIFSGQRTGTGFFVDDNGRLVTALHVVAGCARVVIAKEGYRLVAEVMARSGRHDLALLQVARTLGLAAVFPDSARADPRDMVFVAGYDALSSLQTGRDVLANATVAGHGDDGELALDSSVSHGASGATVLDSQGLVQGVISRRTTSGRVLAISVGDTKAFLAANGVGIVQDDRAQIAPLASRANRAASHLSAGDLPAAMTMTKSVEGPSDAKAAWHAAPAIAGAFLIACYAVALSSALAAYGIDYKPPDQVPPSWIQYSKLVKYRFEEWLQASDPVADRFRIYVKEHAGKWDGPPPMMTVRAWINTDGTMAKVAFDDLEDADATKDLHTLLMRGNIGEGPPPDMLQPINLRFSVDFSSDAFKR